MAKARRSLTPESKVRAARLVTEQAKSIAEVACGLCLCESLPRSWETAQATGGPQAFPGQYNPQALQEEPHSPNVEDKRLLMGRDLTREATASFAGESS